VVSTAGSTSNWLQGFSPSQTIRDLETSVDFLVKQGRGGRISTRFDMAAEIFDRMSLPPQPGFARMLLLVNLQICSQTQTVSAMSSYSQKHRLN
jgi:hypothetical protein